MLLACLTFHLMVYLIARKNGMAKDFKLNAMSTVMTIMLAVIYFGSRKFLKKGISPIVLIVISAILGILVYGCF